MSTITLPSLRSTRTNPVHRAVWSSIPKAFKRKAKQAKQPMPSLEPATKRDPLWGEILAAVALAGTVIIAMVGFLS